MSADDQGLLIGFGVFLVLGWAYQALKSLRARNRQKRLEFFEFWIHHGHACSLEEALNGYIKKYHLCIRLELDEPAKISVLRSKLAILEEMLLERPEFCDDSEVRNYQSGLANALHAYDLLSPQGKAAYAPTPAPGGGAGAR